jgi:tousled-like kinase
MEINNNKIDNNALVTGVDIFGTNDMSNEAKIRIQKLELRLSGQHQQQQNKKQFFKPVSVSASQSAQKLLGTRSPEEKYFNQRMSDVNDDDDDDDDRERARAASDLYTTTTTDTNNVVEKEILADSEEEEDYEKMNENSKDSHDSHDRENRIPTTIAKKGSELKASKISTGKKRKNMASGGFATVSASTQKNASEFQMKLNEQTTNNDNNNDNNNNNNRRFSSDGGMIAQLENATGVTALHISPREQALRKHTLFGSSDSGRSRDGSDVPREVFQPPLQRELFSSTNNNNYNSNNAQAQANTQAAAMMVQKEQQEKIAALEQRLEEVTREREDAERRVESIAKKLNTDEKAVEVRRRRARNAFMQLGKLERAESRRKLRDRSQVLGCVAVRRIGTQLNEIWEDGEAFTQLEDRMRKIAEQKKDAEERRRAIKRKLPPPGSTASNNNNNNNENENNTTSDVHKEFALSEEVHKTRVNQLRREEEAISREREVLEREKLALAREIKRTRDEDDSRFNDFPMLGGQEPGFERYVLTNLLGRGGFSEVYRAWDCHEMKEVACKLHSLNPRWSEERKRAYVRHAARECSIHKSLKHDHVVKLLDVFEVDSDTFCTVLELCEGDDLDARLKNSGTMSEREARAIVAQIFAGLAYCHGDTKRVIHYDLKPGNILFDNSGRVKITDFGLSKVMESRTENADFTSVELTSQGAGTYWYLPPECFETGPAPPKISSKVDVWSVGVIFYQMVYGKRPFGHEQTQEQILQSGTIRDAKVVEFPSKPAISNEAKAFIRNCLSYRQSERPDVIQAANDSYLQFGGKP